MEKLEWDRNFALEQAGDDEEMLSELLNLLRTSSTASMVEIKKGLNNGNPEAVAEAAHSMKGAAASMGLADMRAIAYDIEMSGRNGNLDITDLVNRMDRIITKLNELR